MHFSLFISIQGKTENQVKYFWEKNVG